MANQIGSLGPAQVPSAAAAQTSATPASSAAPQAQAPVLADSFQSQATSPTGANLAALAASLGVSPNALLATLASGSQAPTASVPMPAPADAGGAPGMGGAPGVDPNNPFAKAAALAQQKADALNKKNAPDFETVDVSDFKTAPGEWAAQAKKCIGGGDAKKIEKFISDSKPTFEKFSNVLAISAGKEPPTKTAPPYAALYRPIMSALQACYPSAQFTLTAAAPGSLDGKGGYDKDVVIQMSVPQKNNQTQTLTFGLCPDAFLSNDGAAKIQGILAGSPQLGAVFEAALKTVAPQVAAAGPKALNTDAGRMAMALAILSMPQGSQKSLYDAMGKGKGLEFGGLLKSVQLPDPNCLVIADGSSLVSGQPSKSIRTSVSVGGANDKSKNYKFYKQSPNTLFAPIFFNAMMTPTTTQNLSVQGNSVSKFVEAVLPKSPQVTAQIRHVISSMGLSSARVTAVPMILNSPDWGQAVFSIFRIDTKDGPRFVDQDGRKYSSFNDWKSHNQLPPGQMTYAEGGYLSVGKDGQMNIRTENTPMTVDTLWEKLKGKMNTAIFPMIAANVTLGMLWPVSGALEAAMALSGEGMMVPLAQQTFGQIYDRWEHGQTINPVKYTELTDAYLMLVSMFGGYLSAKLLSIGTAEGSGSRSQALFAPVGAGTEGLASKLAETAPVSARIGNITAHIANWSGTAMVANMDREMIQRMRNGMWAKLPKSAQHQELIQNFLFTASTLVGSLFPMQLERFHEWEAAKLGRGVIPGTVGYVPRAERAVVDDGPTLDDRFTNTSQMADAAERAGLLVEQSKLEGVPRLVNAGVEAKAIRVDAIVNGEEKSLDLKPNQLVNGKIPVGLLGANVGDDVTVNQVSYVYDAQARAPEQITTFKNDKGEKEKTVTLGDNYATGQEVAVPILDHPIETKAADADTRAHVNYMNYKRAKELVGYFQQRAQQVWDKRHLGIVSDYLNWQLGHSGFAAKPAANLEADIRSYAPVAAPMEQVKQRLQDENKFADPQIIGQRLMVPDPRNTTSETQWVPATSLLSADEAWSMPRDEHGAGDLRTDDGRSLPYKVQVFAVDGKDVVDGALKDGVEPTSMLVDPAHPSTLRDIQQGYRQPMNASTVGLRALMELGFITVPTKDGMAFVQDPGDAVLEGLKAGDGTQADLEKIEGRQYKGELPDGTKVIARDKASFAAAMKLFGR